MSIHFSECDRKLYELVSNQEFMEAYKILIFNGYKNFLDIEEMQALINLVAAWYVIKYPEREFEYYDGIKCDYFSDVKKLSSNMNIKQLLYRLTKKQFCLLQANYRSSDWGIRTYYKNGCKIENEDYITIKIKCLPSNPNYQKYAYFKLIVNPRTGLVEDTYEIRKYKKDDEEITIDELLERIKSDQDNQLDFSLLENCILNHNSDIFLRNKVLELIALKLLYSKSTTKERGLLRAKRFIREFNKHLNIELSTNFLDEELKAYKEKLKKWHGIEQSSDNDTIGVDSWNIAKRIE